MSFTFVEQIFDTMIYRTLGLMSGSSLDGLDMALVEFEEIGGKWKYTILAAGCDDYPDEMKQRLVNATTLPAVDYLQLDVDFGKLIGNLVNHFIEKNQLQHQVQLIALHGHTTFHRPYAGVSAWLGNAAQVAASTKINVVSDLRAMDVALGGQGAPIVPLGEKLLFPGFNYFLNIGGIANISILKEDKKIAFDVCAANKVLNMLAAQRNLTFDKDGAIAAAGNINTALLTALNKLEYYRQDYPKSLANDFGIETVYPLVNSAEISLEDKMRTYTEHIATQIALAVNNASQRIPAEKEKLFVSGGGALNAFLIKRLTAVMQQYNIEVFVPDKETIEYKEAIIMALLATLRWREENTIMNEITGASRASIGGAVWIGQEY